MRHCASQHRTVPSPPDTPTTERHFPFCSGTSFFLELLVIALCSSPVVQWTPSHLGGLLFQCHIFLPFCTVHGVLAARLLEWFSIFSSSGPRFVRILPYNPSCELTYWKTLWSSRSITEEVESDCENSCVVRFINVVRVIKSWTDFRVSPKTSMHWDVCEAQQMETLEFGAEEGLLQGHSKRLVTCAQKPWTPW